ncbi:trypsin-like peptidase domain-containing protein [Actinorugispora endophytica]|uniref:Putative serine protease PepD n=1 Tax=Actinorugispora endophytica TaxID=1605990 RepID=A0A4R6USC6_9ACTN|nr:trypsin-like peptidase domain-containing protein [Actinorugispora endophytica]TDQ49982.1 putative serine protease PepD [Actinorugispora endophytica]
MSAFDRDNGSPVEEPENTGVPQDDGPERAADITGAEETGPVHGAPASRPQAFDAGPAASFDRAAPGPEPQAAPIGRSAVPQRPTRGRSLFPRAGAARPTGPAGQPSSDPSRGHWAEPPRDPSPTGPFTAYSGGFGAPPVPPHGPFPQDPSASWPAPRPAGADQRSGRSRTALIAAATALVTSLVVGPTAAVATSQLLSDQGPISSLETAGGSASSGSVSTVADTTLPSVVSISTATGGGSGFVVSSDGLIVTNNHVVSGAEELAVRFDDGTEAAAAVVGTDPVSDLAVIQAEGVSGLAPAVLGDSDRVEVGADVVAIGSPLGLSGTVTSGVVSALDRPVNTGSTQEQPEEGEQEEGQEGPFGLPEQQERSAPRVGMSTVIDAIQTDAPINPGNSGGPLMNMSGEVIGINTAIATTSSGVGSAGQSGSIGLGFAIPVNQARPIIEELIADGEASYAAIEATITVPEDDAPGARVVEANPDGAADQAGLRADDVITKVDDRVVSDPDVLIAEIRSHRPGDTVTVTYQRDGETAEALVTLSGQSASAIGE